MSKKTVQLGRQYKTKGGWTAFIYTFTNGNPQGWCRDSSGKEESYMGTWDENTGKCIKRGNFTQDINTAPYDIIDLISE